MANSSISLTSLDHDTIKADLKNFLKTQSAFKDYNYDGANMNVLLDVLAHNTFLNSFYLNMIGSEMFMDSAQMRDSVVSHAKDLNYTPRSMSSSVATVNATFTTSGITTSQFTIPKGTQFSGVNDTGSYIFSTAKTETYISSNNVFAVNDLKLYEGTYQQDSYLMNYQLEGQQFLLTDSTADIESIAVYVIENNTTVEFTKAQNLYGLDENSDIYFLQATTKNRYEVVFGDGIFGRRPLDGATIILEYRICKGEDGNGVKTFIIDQNLGAPDINNCAIDDVTIETSSASSGGSAAESIERIRYNAPRHYQTQDRAVTTNDYRNLILENYPEINSVNVYGGEDVAGAVEYGTVFISATTYSGTPLSTPRKTEIINFLNERSAIGISPKMVNPDYLYVFGSVDVNIDQKQTNLTAAQIKTAVINAINDYNDVYLKQFGSVYRSSKLASLIQAVDPSIQSVVISATMKKIVVPNFNVSQAVSVDFHNNEIIPSNIISSQFMINGKVYVLTDYNPNNDTFVREGTPNLFYIRNSSKNMYLKEISTQNIQNYTTITNAIDYTKATIDIQNLQINSFLGNAGIEFYCTPYYDDIYALKNDVVEIDVNNLVINIFKDTVTPIAAI